jgi:hypothetical protein
MTKPKQGARKTRMDLAQAPPVLAALVNQQGNLKRLSEKLNYSVAILRQMTNGERPIPPDLEAKMQALLVADGGPVPNSDGSTSSPLPITTWDGTRRDATLRPIRGKPTILKKIPRPLADLVDKLTKAKGEPISQMDLARAVGLSGFNMVAAHAKKDAAYNKNLHTKVIAALRGDIMPGSAADVALTSGGVDTFKLRLAIVFTNAANYDRVTEIADVIGGKRSFRRNTKTSLIVIYSFKSAGKCGQFKRLALRDATEIICP